jgi:hypothetical protein
LSIDAIADVYVNNVGNFRIGAAKLGYRTFEGSFLKEVDLLSN